MENVPENALLGRQVLNREKPWPTPRAANPGSRPNGKGGEILAEQARLSYATPRAEDSQCAGRRHNRDTSDTLYAQTVTDTNSTPGSLSPDWVELLMGFPLGWSRNEPMNVDELRRWMVSVRLSHMLYLGHGITESTRDPEAVRILRRDDDPQEVRGEADAGGLDIVQAPSILLSDLLQLKTKLDEEADLSLASAKTAWDELRRLRTEDESASPSRRWGTVAQQPREYPDSLHSLPQVSPRYGIEAWQEGTWETSVPRVATKVADRVNRLRGLGNAQCPQTMAAAFTLLAREAGVLR
jgi:hypothetical protein